ncbi:hypothetical protein LTR62_001951 [Meristemomyces frigidus]|uniref:Ca3427-like PBP 2 domain-containing protein n=1 Tax=Meristemomyces frigidus TaxID=1508187 RepID=A0AAN7TFE0_9PEZI|nr:hypothetical protein LTR62_001951 [Meristemomyces frigidus]
MSTRKPLRIGYIPEHFSTPLHFASTHHNLSATLIPEPLGTGALTTRLKLPIEDDKAFDVAIGLTEGFVADLGRSKAGGKDAGFGLVGTYVESPLCWAISTGAERDEIKSVQDLKGGKVGVSRIGSGSYVMSYVLADSQGWLEQGQAPFGIEVIGDFAALRKSVRKEKDAKSTDFFMWEHFTTKHFWDNGSIKRIGEIYTPWPSWMIAARDPGDDERLDELFTKLDEGVKHYGKNREEAVQYISTDMHYSKEDAGEWMKTVRFAAETKGVDVKVVEETVKVLRKAGVLDGKAGDGADMIAIERKP